MRILVTLFFTVIIAGFVFCQDSLNAGITGNKNISNPEKSSDSVDVRALLQSQIDIAREKEKEEELKINQSNSRITSNEIKTPPKNLSSFDLFSNILFIKAGVIMLFAVSTFSYIFFRRRRIRNKKDFNKIFKKNINLIRAEKLFSKEDNPALNSLRNQLVENESITSRSISSKAKELHISKGELILASKIKSYQLAQIGFKNK